MTETLQVHHGMNEMTHDEENSSEAENDTSEDENVAEIQTYENNGKKNEHEDKLQITNFPISFPSPSKGTCSVSSMMSSWVLPLCPPCASPWASRVRSVLSGT